MKDELAKRGNDFATHRWGIERYRILRSICVVKMLEGGREGGNEWQFLL